MEISYHKFKLTPRQSLNRLSGTSSREGVFLRSKHSFWEYFPHPELGDLGLEEFLSQFARQDHVSTQKALLTLSRPLPKALAPRVFHNHYLWQGAEASYFPVIKYKLKSHTDRMFLDFKCGQLRLDANGLFDSTKWKEFESSLPEEFKQKIDYIEDPLNGTEWSEVKMRCARDFIAGSPATFTIYKPYREFYPSYPRVIFSGNMGHALSQYLSYLELMEFGQLSLVHGLINPPIYENVPTLFKGDYERGFILDTERSFDFIQSLGNLEWKSLCSL